MHQAGHTTYCQFRLLAGAARWHLRWWWLQPRLFGRKFPDGHSWGRWRSALEKLFRIQGAVWGPPAFALWLAQWKDLFGEPRSYMVPCRRSQPQRWWGKIHSHWRGIGQPSTSTEPQEWKPKGSRLAESATHSTSSLIHLLVFIHALTTSTLVFFNRWSQNPTGASGAGGFPFSPPTFFSELDSRTSVLVDSPLHLGCKDIDSFEFIMISRMETSRVSSDCLEALAE